MGSEFKQRQGANTHFICKASGLLVNGLVGGAITADYYISANQEWMEKAVAAGLVERSMVRSLWSNVLVVAAPRGTSLALERWEDLDRPEVRQILIGDPGTAPFVRYAKQAMEASGIWATVRPRIATSKNISILAETLAAADEGTVGILFATSLSEALRPLVRVPIDRHESIRYFSAPLNGREKDGNVRAFIEFLEGSDGRAIFHDAGFEVLP